MEIFQKLFNISNQKKGMANIPAEGPYGMPYRQAESLLFDSADPSLTLHGGFKPRNNIDVFTMEDRIKDRDAYLQGKGFRDSKLYNRSTFGERLGEFMRGN